MMQIIKNKFSNMSLKSKIISISMINIIIISAVAFAILEIYSAANEKLLYSKIAESLSYSSNEISNRLTNVQTISHMTIGNSDLQNALSVIKDSDNYVERSIANDTLYARIIDYYQTFKANSISYINLHNSDFSTYTYRERANKVPKEVYNDILKQTRAKDGAPCWITSYIDEYGLFLGQTVRRAKNIKLDYLGDLVICVNMDSMINAATKAVNSYDNMQYLLFDNGNMIYHSDAITETEIKFVNKGLSHRSYSVISAGKHSYFAVRGNILNFDWDYVCLVPYDNIMATLHIAQGVCFLIIILAVILGFLLSHTLACNITCHFSTLITKMKAFGKDETHLPETTNNYKTRQDELGLLHRQFDSMAQKIQNLIRVNYVSELLKKEAQLKALQSQISPHFLYNTLTSISWRAKASGEKEIASIVEALSTLLRSMLSKDEAKFTLERELEVVRCYMFIQKMRYEERIEYKIAVEDYVSKINLPKLTIQPLVENAIQYGLKQISEVCRIEITCCLYRKNVCICVKNSGSLFEENHMEKLKNGQILTNGFGIGLLNIDERLKLTFGEKYGLTLYNKDELAVAEIEIPFFNSQEDTIS